MALLQRVPALWRSLMLILPRAPQWLALITSSDALHNVEVQRLFTGEQVTAIRQKRAQLQASYAAPGHSIIGNGRLGGSPHFQHVACVTTSRVRQRCSIHQAEHAAAETCLRSKADRLRAYSTPVGAAMLGSSRPHLRTGSTYLGRLPLPKLRDNNSGERDDRSYSQNRSSREERHVPANDHGRLQQRTAYPWRRIDFRPWLGFGSGCPEWRSNPDRDGLR